MRAAAPDSRDPAKASPSDGRDVARSSSSDARDVTRPAASDARDVTRPPHDGRDPTGVVPSALLSAVMASASSALLMADARGTVVTANPAFELLTNLSVTELRGRLLVELLAPGQEAQARTVTRAAMRNSVWQGDLTIVTRDGGPLSLRVKITPVTGTRSQLTHLVIEARDQARQRVLSEIDPEAQTLGRLSSSIAHDFNNQLSVIINYTHILARQVGKDSPLQTHLHDMQTTAWRASKLAQQLIVLGRKPMAEPQSLNLNQVITNLAPLLRTMLGEKVKLRTTLDPSLWPVHMALPQAEQVLVNLAVNAREAIHGAGEVELSTCNVTLRGDDPARPAELPAGRYVRFTLSEKAAASDPTTVTPVDATTPLSGLGPSMIYRAIQQAGGSLALVANEDGSTTFRIHVPALNADSDAQVVGAGIHTLA